MRPPRRLRVDPVACDGHGLCAELLPEMIILDDWGYPIVAPGEVPPGLLAHARRAVSACPVLALHLVALEAPLPGGAPAGSARRG